MRRLKSFLLILIAIWLPVQTVAAMVMPFCGHAGGLTVQVTANAPAPCHEHAAPATPATNSAGGASASDLGCDNCEMCHLASAGYIPPAATALPLPVASVFVARPMPVLHSHIAEPPQQPPRRLN